MFCALELKQEEIVLSFYNRIQNFGDVVKTCKLSQDCTDWSQSCDSEFEQHFHRKRPS